MTNSGYRGFACDQHGLSLLELTVVAAVISILAGMIAVAVVGVSADTKEKARLSDMAEITKASRTFTGTQAASHYPTVTGCKGGEAPDAATSLCVADALASAVDEAVYGVDVDGDGLTTNAAAAAAGIDWDAVVGMGDTRTFAPDFAHEPPHARESAGGQRLWVVNGRGEAVVLIPGGKY